MIWRIVFVRLRFLLILGAAFVLVTHWDWVRQQWRKLTRATTAGIIHTPAESPEIEYWCPMCPGVAADWKMKCPVCNMALVPRRRGEAVASLDGSVPRMQLSPYRIQLAGIQTSAIEYRPLAFEVVTGGIADRVSDAAQNMLQLSANVYEKDVAVLKEGLLVEIGSDSSPRRTAVIGRLTQLVRTEQRPGATALIQIENPGGELTPGSFVTARIKVPAADLEWLARACRDEWNEEAMVEEIARALTSHSGVSPPLGLRSVLRMACHEAMRQRGCVLSILDSAIIDTGRKKIAYRETGPGMFEAVEVVVGPRCGEYRPVLRGVEAGQRVASAGAFLVDAETRLNPAVAAAYFGAARPAAPARPSSDIEQALAPLSPDDQALVRRQKLCPVTDEPLGSMGTPVRVQLSGKTVFLCCQGCEAELKANETKYLSKLLP
jgi:hypothetical protein